MTSSRGTSLPVMLEPVGKNWVVTGSEIPDLVHVGDVVVSVDETPLAALRKHLESLASGRPSSLPWKSVQAVLNGPIDAPPLHFVMRHADGSTSTVALRHTQAAWVRRRLPAALAQLDHGIWYVDLSRVDKTSLQTHIDELTRARSDLRRPPLPARLHGLHLDPAAYPRAPQARAMDAHPALGSPDGRPTGFTDLGWDLTPASPHFESKALFLSRGNSISAAEAILGYVKDEHLGPIVGARSRGVDGDITWVVLSTRFRAIFTGMKVTRHDGHTRYQAIGTPPDIHVRQTLTGIRAGRDEALDAALKIARSGSPVRHSARTSHEDHVALHCANAQCARNTGLNARNRLPPASVTAPGRRNQ